MRHADDARVSSAQPACGRCSRGSAPSSAPGGASRTEPPLRMSATPSKFSFTEAEYVRLALRTMLAAQFRTTGTRTMLAGECPLFSAWGALRGRSPRSASPLCRRGAALLQAQLAQIAFRNRLHLIQAPHTTQRLCPRITRRSRTHRQTGRRPQHTDHRSHRIRIRIH